LFQNQTLQQNWLVVLTIINGATIRIYTIKNKTSLCGQIFSWSIIFKSLMHKKISSFLNVWWVMCSTKLKYNHTWRQKAQWALLRLLISKETCLSIRNPRYMSQNSFYHWSQCIRMFPILFFYLLHTFGRLCRYFFKNLSLCQLFSNCLTDKKQIYSTLNKVHHPFHYHVCW